MTKLSDALRGMADRAPIEDASISTVNAVNKVRQRRALRVSANSLVGVGAAAVLAFAVVIPSTSGNPGAADGDALSAAEAPSANEGSKDFAADAAVGYGYCGGSLAPAADDQPGTLTVAGVGADAVDPGSTLDLETTLTVTDEVTGALVTPVFYVLWNGIVVGTSYGDGSQAAETTFAAGEDVTTSQDLVLVNCWDGSSLPGGTYQVIATQELYPAAIAPSEAPGEPAPEPAVDPAVVEETTVDDAATSDIVTSDIAPPSDSVMPYYAGYVFTSTESTLTVTGDVPEDPFGQYLYPPVPELPDNYLTPAEAREQYAAAVITGTWDMAEGSQRVVLTGDSADTTGTLWEKNYYGCSWDGGAARPFTTSSAQLDWLDVQGTVPDRISVSHGWVVNDNPEVPLSVTNTSGFALPQMYEPNASLVLVQDGVVVAEAYLSNLNRTPSYSDALYMEPGDSVAGDYLWRDVNGCWSGDQSLPVEAGTYTVLNVQYLYLSDYASGPIAYGDEDLLSSSTEGDTGGGSSSEPDVRSIDPAMSFAAPGGDYSEYQVWTSLGTVRVTD